MHVHYRCPHCDATVREEMLDGGPLACSQCGRKFSSLDPREGNPHIDRCLVCGSDELFVRKNFPQRLGVTIVVIGFAISCVTWYFHYVYATFAVLFATAGIDFLLFWLMGNLLECYRCHAQFVGAASPESHGPFDLEVHERYRQEQIRLREASTAAGANVQAPISK
jgi:hypothetical protein